MFLGTVYFCAVEKAVEAATARPCMGAGRGTQCAARVWDIKERRKHKWA